MFDIFLYGRHFEDDIFHVYFEIENFNENENFVTEDKIVYQSWIRSWFGAY